MRKQLAIFVVRWAATSIGIWLSIQILGGVVSGYEPDVLTYIGAGLAFSIVNSLLKPIITILSLPAILLTLGLFILVVNGFMVYVALLLVPSLKLNFVQAIIAGFILSFINYVISGLIELYNERQQSKSRGIMDI